MALPHTAILPGPEWFEDNLVDPDFFAVSWRWHSGCTAVVAQPQGAQSATLAMSDLAIPNPG